ncbi:MAG: hypothetical protein SGARI_002486 [Bacillariaceae sp.]
MSNGLHSAFLVLGMDTVPLPSFEDIEFAPAPLKLDIDKMLKTGKKLRQHDWIVHAPFLLPNDLDTKSAEYNKISPSARQHAPAANADSMWWMLPTASASLVYEDAAMMAPMQDVLYVSSNEVMMPFLHLDPTKKCSSSVNRFELEVVAEHAGHRTFKGAAERRFYKDNDLVTRRVDALKALGQAVAKKPYNEDLVQAARTQVLKVGGPELLMEAGMTAAFFEGIATKVVDGTRKEPMPEACYAMMSYMLWLVQVLYDAVNFFTSKLLRK